MAHDTHGHRDRRRRRGRPQDHRPALRPATGPKKWGDTRHRAVAPQDSSLLGRTIGIRLTGGRPSIFGQSQLASRCACRRQAAACLCCPAAAGHQVQPCCRPRHALPGAGGRDDRGGRPGWRARDRVRLRPDVTAGLRAHPGLAPRGLRQPRLPRRHPRLQGKAGTGVPRRTGRAPGGAGPAAARRGRGTRTVGSGRTQRTRSPGAAPSSGCSRNRPGEPFSSAWLAASTMPSLRPNFILRGARLATITVIRPTSCSGA